MEDNIITDDDRLELTLRLLDEPSSFTEDEFIATVHMLLSISKLELEMWAYKKSPEYARELH